VKNILLMRLKLQKESALKLVSRIIPRSGGHDTIRFLFGIHARGQQQIGF
jgi:hypothetical protein